MRVFSSPSLNAFNKLDVVPICKVGPVVNGKPAKNRNLHSAPDCILLMIIRVTGGEIPNPMKLPQEVVSCASGQTLNDFNHFEIDEQAILHQETLLRKPPAEVVEFYPMSRI